MLKLTHQLRNTKGVYSSVACKVRAQGGFTLVETLVSIGIFSVLVTLTGGLLFNAFAGNRKAEISRNLYEESRIAVERIVKEARKGTIDYEEYWNWYHTPGHDYGENYGNYALQFFDRGSGVPPDTIADKTRFHENTGTNLLSNNEALLDGQTHAGCSSTDTDPNFILTSTGYEQCELYLINAEGTEKTVVRILEVAATGEYQLKMLKLFGSDTDDDGQVDSWDPSPEFQDSAGNAEFQLIQPDKIQITSLKFFIAPIEDPRKAFATFTDDTQQQPHLTIVLTAEPAGTQHLANGDRVLSGVRGQAPEITLQTTVAARAQSEVKSLK